MARRRGKKKSPEQLAKEAAEKQEALRLAQENESKQFFLGQAIMKVSTKLTDGYETEVAHIKHRKDFELKWSKMFQYGKFPPRNDIPKIREYISKLEMQLKSIFGDEFDWTLRVDERSLLQQNLERVDLSRRTLKDAETDIGAYYSSRVGKVEYVVQDIIEYLSVNKSTIDSSQSLDLFWILLFIREYSRELIDRHTMKILRNVEQNMSSLDSITSNYESKSPIYNLELWSYRPVPLTSRLVEVKQINFDSMNLVVTIPRGIIFDCAVRGVWHNYDHLSQHATGSILPQCDKEILDLKASQAKLWDIRNALIEFRLNEMREARQNYEEAVRLKEEQELARLKAANEDTGGKPKGKKKKEKRKKKIKLPPEPPIVTADTLVDVTKDLADFYENEENDFLRSISPESLGQEDYELNLREYRIMGGTYSIHCLAIPNQPKIIPNAAFQFTYLKIPVELKYIHYKNLMTVKDLEKKLSLVPTPRKLSRKSAFVETPRVSRLVSKRVSVSEAVNPMRRASMAPPTIAPEKLDRERAKSRLELLTEVQIEIVLPTTVFWWEEPLVYIWESWEEKPPEQQLKEDIEYSHMQPVEVDYGLLTKKVLKDCSNITEVKDFNFCNVPWGEINLRCLALQHIVPRTPLHFQFAGEISIDNLRELANEHEVEKFHLGLFIPKEDFQQVVPKTLFPVEPNPDPLKILDSPDIPKESLVQRKQCLYMTVFNLLEEIEKFRLTEVPIFKDEARRMSVDDDLRSRTSFHEAARFRASRKRSKPSSPKEDTKRMSSGDNVDLSNTLFPDAARTRASRKKTKAFSIFTHPNLLGLKTKHVERSQPSRLSVGKWSCESVFETEYDEKMKSIKFCTSKLGTIGIAQRKYINLPFIHWTLRPDEKDPELMLLVLTGAYFKLMIEITANGYAYELLQPRQKDNQKLLYNLRDFKEILRKQGLDVFPERDAICYVEKHCEKHIEMEMHTYKCMGLFCRKYQYEMNIWNQYSVKRLATLSIGEHYANASELREIMVTPEKCNFVHIEELCTDLTIIQLKYNLEPPEQDHAPDLYNLLMASKIPNPTRGKNDALELQWNVASMLQAVRVLSFSHKPTTHTL